MKYSKFKAGDSIMIRTNRRTRFQKLDHRVGLIIEEPKLTSSWELVYEIKLDAGGTVDVDEEDLGTWNQTKKILHQRQRLASLYHLPLYNG